MLALLCGVSAEAATPAGTVISNIAQIDYRLDGSTFSRPSNQVDIRVGEIIDFTVAPAPVCAAIDGVTVVGFDITNKGNGREAFIPGQPVVTGAPSFVLTGVFADTNRSGCYESGADRRIPTGGKTDPVDPGATARMFVVGTGGAGGGRIVLPITSETGDGGTGRAYLGGGDGGGDAVIGASGGAVGDVSAPLPGNSGLTATLVKAQSVHNADGSTDPRYGAVVTYSIEGRFTGTGTATGAAIADAIPAGTDYVPGSIMLDGQRLSDANGDDAGGFDGQRIAVSLGNVAAPAVHSISFQVRIK